MGIPRESVVAAALGLYTDGYKFIHNRCELFRSDIFRIGPKGLNTVCIRGEEAARIFYDPEKMMRKGAVPSPVQQTLTGKDAIHTTDGSTHQNRKQMFNALLTEGNIKSLNSLFKGRLKKSFEDWQRQPSVVLFTEAQQALCYAICTWAGVPLAEEDIVRRAADFVCMVDAFGSMGLRNIKGRLARHRAEKWIENIIKKVRAKKLIAAPNSALAVVANHTGTDGKLLSNKMAAIELINILRPTVAISWYIVFAAEAACQNPTCRKKFAEDQDGYRDRFVNEVRRFYPFAPFMGARVKQDFTWNGHEFKKGGMVLLDMYGTNHDERLWQRPFTFDPDRFKRETIRPFDFLAQGGGDVRTGHRCPGELITVTLLKTAMEFLTKDINYTVPKQDLSIPLSRMPAIVRSGFVITNMRKLVA